MLEANGAAPGPSLSNDLVAYACLLAMLKEGVVTRLDSACVDIDDAILYAPGPGLDLNE